VPLSQGQKIEKARELRAQNVTCREIGARLGVSKDTAYRWTWDVVIPRECPGCGEDLTDRHGKTKWCSDRCRKETLYSGECIDCGGRTTGKANGLDRVPDRCRECAKATKTERNELLREMWEADKPTWYIAQSLGMTEGAVTSWIHTERSLRDRRDLSLRRLGGDSAERERRHRYMIVLRRQGLTNAEVAEIVGMASADAVSTAFGFMRRKGWTVPPAPRQSHRREQVAV
jgi:transposase